MRKSSSHFHKLYNHESGMLLGGSLTSRNAEIARGRAWPDERDCLGQFHIRAEWVRRDVNHALSFGRFGRELMRQVHHSLVEVFQIQKLPQWRRSFSIGVLLNPCTQCSANAPNNRVTDYEDGLLLAVPTIRHRAGGCLGSIGAVNRLPLSIAAHQNFDSMRHQHVWSALNTNSPKICSDGVL